MGSAAEIFETEYDIFLHTALGKRYSQTMKKNSV